MGSCRKYTKRNFWSEEEIQTLIKLSEKYTSSDIAKKMGRERSSVKDKMQDLGLRGLIFQTDKWTFAQIAETVGVSRSSISKTWVRNGLKYVKRGYYSLVSEKELLRFMQEYLRLWDATKCDYYMFYRYQWFMDKLQADREKTIRSTRKPWTPYEKQQFAMLKKKGYANREIAEEIGRSLQAVNTIVQKWERNRTVLHKN